MWSKLIVASLGVISFAGWVAADTFVGGSFSDPDKTGYTIKIVSTGSWSDAQAFAASQGGDLMSIHSDNENTWVVDNVLKDFTGSGGPNLSNVPVWIGYYDPNTGDGSGSTHKADFEWSDSSANDYTNWNTATGEPNNANDTEYFTAINWHYAQNSSNDKGTWNDAPNGGTAGYGGNSDGTYYGLAEIPNSVPSPAAFYGGGLLMTFLAANKMRRQV